ncbi:MAG TPA: NRDE family protein [Ignavibacteriaceae bacterium]|nr:NRDE family protein [Ignavibacteriaceae bacterium]
MCLIVLAYNHHPDYKLIFAANRDEFYERPTLSAHFWKNDPILAGKDLKEGGTWCGITKAGRFAAITNYRNIKTIKKDALSRGKIVTDYLTGTSTPELYSKGLADSANQYNGYCLIFGDETGLFFFSNQNKKFIKIEAGIHGLSNHLLDTPWFNVKRGRELLKQAVDKKDNLVDDLFSLLRDKTLSPDEELPETGLKKEIEKQISSVYVETPDYGTRSSTVILIDQKNNVTFIEKSLDADKNWITNEFSIELLI